MLIEYIFRAYELTFGLAKNIFGSKITVPVCFNNYSNVKLYCIFIILTIRNCLVVNLNSAWDLYYLVDHGADIYSDRQQTMCNINLC